MAPAATSLVARPLDGLYEVRDAREPVRVLVASLAPGGAERIVLEWLAAEHGTGRQVELAVLHGRRITHPVPSGLPTRVRGSEDVATFLRVLAGDWRSAKAPVSTHLVTDEHLGLFWESGIRTVPVIHNMPAGWRNAPAAWRSPSVPLAVACAEAVRREAIASGCRVPVLALVHRPRVGAAATDPALRAQMREELRVGPDTMLVAAIGAMKAQKDHARAVEVMAQLLQRRDAVLVILGGILDSSGTAELDRVLDAGLRLGVSDRIRLPGFVPDVEPWLAACDALLNVSRYEGLSIAVQEALAAGLPVVATDVGGQAEIAHPALEVVPAEASAADIAARLARHPVRRRLERAAFARAPRAWSLTLASRPAEGPALDTLFVTANLNAGGAQRSLVNLALAIAGRHRLAVAVCGGSTHEYFARELADRGVEVFGATLACDDHAVAESLLAHASRRGARTLCFWNVAPGVKLLVSRFAPASLRLVDVSPGRYAFEELMACEDLARAIGHPVQAHYARLDVLVLKHADPEPPAGPRRVVRIPNGVQARRGSASAPCRFIVSGRLAPSKRLETILDAFARVRSDVPDAQLHVIGPAEPRHGAYAQALAAHAGPGVTFRGADFDLAYLGEPWTAALVLGVHQGCPNAVLEAMAAGIPVIANDSGGTAEALDGGRAGYLLAQDVGPEGLARAMREVLGAPGVARDVARRALAHVRAHHSMASMAAAYLDILSESGAPVAREKIGAWNSASAPLAPGPSPIAPSPLTASR